MLSMFGGRGVDEFVRSWTNSASVTFSAWLKRRSKPIVEEALSSCPLRKASRRRGPGRARRRPAVGAGAAGCRRGRSRPHRLAREVGPRGVADQQRVAGDHEPRLVAARAVDHLEAAVLGPVAGRVHDADDDVAQRDLLAVVERLVRVLGLGRGMDMNRQPCSSAKRPWPDTWSAWVWVSSTRVIRTCRFSASSGKARSRTRDRRPRPHPRTRRRSGRTRSRGRRRRTAETARQGSLQLSRAGI